MAAAAAYMQLEEIVHSLRDGSGFGTQYASELPGQPEAGGGYTSAVPLVVMNRPPDESTAIPCSGIFWSGSHTLGIGGGFWPPDKEYRMTCEFDVQWLAVLSWSATQR